MTIQEEKRLLRQEIRRKIKEYFSAKDVGEANAQALAKIKFRLADFFLFRDAQSLMIYLNLPTEFPTLPLLSFLAAANVSTHSRRLAVPYCVGDELELFLLCERRLITPCLSSDVMNESFNGDLAKLSEGAFRILEPRSELRADPHFAVSAESLDLIIVPALAFDAQGGRLGKGKGYYDRFFQRLPARIPLLGLAFDWQLVDKIPMEPHDRRVDYILTPSRLIKVG